MSNIDNMCIHCDVCIPKYGTVYIVTCIHCDVHITKYGTV